MPAGDSVPVPRFEFASATRIIFGAGAIIELPQIIAALGKRPVLVAGVSGRRLGPPLDFRATIHVAGEPTVTLAEHGAQVVREHGGDVVIAIGGGSVIDAGKAIAALANNPGPALDYLEVVGRGRPLEHPSLPFVAVPTTAGTGAEVTRNAVLAVTEAHVKVSLRSAYLLPRVALVDPTLTYDLPAAQTAATGLDALTQLIEPFLSSRANPLTDALCRDGIARAARALPVAFREPGNAAARADMALAALYSGMALANAGLGAVHGFAGPIGGRFPAPHGAVCAALLPHVMRGNLAALRTRAAATPSIARFDEVARLLTSDAQARADDGIAWCAQIAREMQIPGLSSWGVTTGHIDELARKSAAASSMKANPIALTHGELTEILQAAL
jgi:alcohol dehydrogenase class IV